MSREIDLRLSDGRTVTIRQTKGHSMDQEIDFVLDGVFVGGNERHLSRALANAVSGVEQRLGAKVVEYNDGGAWTPWTSSPVAE